MISLSDLSFPSTSPSFPLSPIVTGPTHGSRAFFHSPLPHLLPISTQQHTYIYIYKEQARGNELLPS
uniref:Uncharacterized protein n=1 Tax=Leishmania guyanensis TaxID=5670 RepID=A0A1E1J1Z8_LEIGU|nr:Hypothetical protein BN36_3051070 [Leishmania guyanensis]